MLSNKGTNDTRRFTDQYLFYIMSLPKSYFSKYYSSKYCPVQSSRAPKVSAVYTLSQHLSSVLILMCTTVADSLCLKGQYAARYMKYPPGGDQSSSIELNAGPLKYVTLLTGTDFLKIPLFSI